MRYARYYTQVGGNVYSLKRIKKGNMKRFLWRCSYMGRFSKSGEYTHDIHSVSIYDYQSFKEIRKWIYPVSKKQELYITILAGY